MRTIKRFIPVLALGGGILIGGLVCTAINPAVRSMWLAKVGLGPQAVTTTLSAAANGQDLGTQQEAAGEIAVNNNGKSPVAPDLALAITADYKQDLGLFFDAWKAATIEDFRTKMSKAYTGVLLEEHIRQAQEYIPAGTGLDISAIEFSQISVESADINTATLNATYDYVARDYNLKTKSPAEGQYKHSVHVRVNMLKLNGRWLIAGETPLP